MSKKWWIGGVVGTALLVMGGVAWMERTPILAWYYVQRLALAEEETRAAWVEKTVSLGETALPGVLGCLERNDALVCGNAQAALACLLDTWGCEHPSRVILAEQLANAFPRLSGFGKRSALELEAGLVPHSRLDPPAAEVLRAATQMVAAATRVADREVRVRALELACLLLTHAQSAENLDACRELTRSCLQDDEPENRLRGIKLAARPELKLLEFVTPLLSDPEPRVRKAALQALGPAHDTVRDDELLRLLHDPDAEVRRLCEATLRGWRGLSEEHVQRGRLLTDTNPAVRLQVLDGLCQSADLEPGVWLRHLSHDPEPAVRAAAVRAAAEQTVVDLTDRIEQMARDDPSDTIRQMAQHYLAWRKCRPGPSRP
jgi:hypothetical protein